MGRVNALIVGSVLCLFAGPAGAAPDFFGFDYANLHATFDGVSSFVTTDWDRTTGHVYRNQAPAGAAVFLPGFWGGSESFLISMAISNITVGTAEGSGLFVITDTGGDTISGDLNGTWTRASADTAVFAGDITNLVYTSVVDDVFDGHIGGASMSFASSGPWVGTFVQLSAPSGWFTDSSGVPRARDLIGGSVDATVGEGAALVPVPGAFGLSLLGLVGVIRRRRRNRG